MPASGRQGFGRLSRQGAVSKTRFLSEAMNKKGVFGTFLESLALIFHVNFSVAPPPSLVSKVPQN